MAYEKTVWVDGGAPAITAEKLNKIEAGIETADKARTDPTREFVLENRTSDPTNPAIGRMWLRTDL